MSNSSNSRSIPEELIKIKAQEFWKQRQQEGREGTPEDSRQDARQYLQKHRWQVFHWKLTQSLSKRPIKKFADWWETTSLEKFFLEDIKYLLENSAFLSIITLIAEITIILSLLTWITGRKERWEDEIFATWQVVNEASEDQSGVVRIALERLLRNDFSLAGLKLENTNLVRAKLQKANLMGAKLQKANLWSAKLQKADLKQVNLQEAILGYAKLQEANLRFANLQKTDLWFANLQKTDLWFANLQEADLRQANLQKADLRTANLQEAFLEDAENLTANQIKVACFWDKAIYKGEWDEKKETFIAIEPDNTNFIEELKKDKSSDPKEKPDCSRWGK